MTRLRLIILASALAVGALVPGFAPAHDLPELTRESNTITVAKGSQFRIVLSANPTTGFTWGLKGFSRAGVAHVLGCNFVPPSSPIPGRGGTYICLLAATGAGTTTLTLKYARPWTSDGATTQRFVITVTP
ncbi:MAG: protease inhibitor I42 family protein [Vulcanimicrobiaceae bacterium]|jgi:predicted secreted protein